MPRVWIQFSVGYLEWVMLDEEPKQSTMQNPAIAVDMNASLYRQIRSNEKKYQDFRNRLGEIYDESAKTPDKVRRVN